MKILFSFFIIIFLQLGCILSCYSEDTLSGIKRSELVLVMADKNSLRKQEKLIEYIRDKSEIKKYTIFPFLAAICAENKDYISAEKYARKMLTIAKNNSIHWNNGNAIHNGNMVLGIIALSKNKVDVSKKFLIAAGNAPTSPQLYAYGPNMMLADALLEEGEKETVIMYLESLKKVWTKNDGRIDSWIAAIRGGGKPYFGRNLLTKFASNASAQTNKPE